MADWVRDKALMSMTSPLPGDALIPTYLVANEEISQPFSFDVIAVSQKGVVDPDKLLNMPACVILRGPDGPIRYFHGIVQEVRANGIQRGATAIDEFENYALTMVPRLWFLRQTQDCRVYQAKSSKDILTAMFQDAGLTDFTFSVSSSAARPYTIQFNESDYDFALRLMEQEGWFYYFVHTAAKHTLTITDKSSSFPDVPSGTLNFATNENDPNGITDWKAPVRTATGSFAMGDYDPANPGTKLYNKQSTVLKTGGAATRDVYQWPALTPTNSIVEARAKFEIEAAEASVSLYHGVSRFGGLVAGAKFTLKNSPASADDASFALRSVQHLVQDDTWISNDGQVSYQNRFEALKASIPWRQSLSTPHPRMEGIHSALVMGPQSDANTDIKMQSGEEIYTDDLARVKVRFYWDWRAEATGSASIWARVVQPWAGNGWGTQFIPRVGTEVAVAFVDGDPDRPIVVGGLYNGVSAPIYAVADKTKTGIRTRSSLKGDTSKFNELTFDDKSGSELIFIHAEKDMTTEVEHDESLTVDNCRMVLVKVDETIQVKGKQTITITKDHTFEVTEGNYKATIDKGNSLFEVSTGNHDLKVDTGNHTTTIGKGNQTNTVSLGNIKVEASAGSISVKAAQAINIESSLSINLKVGQSTLTLDNTGVTIKGMMIAVAGQVSTDIKGLMTSLKGDAMVTIKGGITMIN
jgi:type VI secretion system secreted protein VgrG